MRKCSRCKVEKPETTDFFYWRKLENRFDSWCKECVKETNKIKYFKNRDKILEAEKVDRRKDPRKKLLYHAKERAKIRNLEFTLTLEDIVIPEVCPVLGIPMFVMDGKTGDNSPTIDRIDNYKGYTPNNVIIISRRANRIKSDASLDELEKIYKFYFNLL